MCSLKKILVTNHIGIGPTLIRLIAGIIFMAHGSQKLFGWFAGGGLAGTTQMMANLGFEPARLFALVCANAEFFGGLLLLIGLLTRLAGLALSINMLTAILTVHISHGFFSSDGGYEYALLLFTCALAFLISGAGRFSFDHLMTRSCPQQHTNGSNANF